MKAVILERKGEDAAVLAENGTFMKVHRAGEVGEEIDIAANVTPMPRLKQRWLKGLAAAALVLVVAGGAYHYTAVSVSAYVSVDAGGSSIEFTVNRLGKVTSVVSVSDTDSELAEALSGSVNGMSVEDAVSSALDTLTEKGALSPREDLVIVGITSGSDSRAESLENVIMSKSEHSVYTVRVSDDEREEAHRQELGGGLYVYRIEDAVTAPAKDEENESDITDAAETAANTDPVTATTVTESASVAASVTEAEDPTAAAETTGADTILPAPETTKGGQPGETALPPQTGQNGVNETADDIALPPQQSGLIFGNEPGDQHNERPDTGDFAPPPQQDGQIFGNGGPPDQHEEQNGQAGSSQMPGGGEIPQQPGQLPYEMSAYQPNGQSGTSLPTGDDPEAPQSQGDAMPASDTQQPFSYAADRAAAPDRMMPPIMSIAADEFSGSFSN